ncbi:tRNA (cytidine/uridine/adenosine-2'-O-)-methyltransferase TrmJ [Gammaproteobacteria bacterium]
MLSNVRIVLVRTSHPGNIGAAARAMKTMGLRQLSLVSPKTFPSPEATARATSAEDLLQETKVYSTLAEAVADCGIVIGASGRSRQIPWPEHTPRSAAALALSQTAPVAIIFGNESTGLSNVELDQCHAVLRIPTHPEQHSLNVAAAVQIVAYELHLATSNVPKVIETSRTPVATFEDVERFYVHLEETLIQIGFLDPEKPGLLMRRLRRLFQRAQLDATELQLLRGILRAAQDPSFRIRKC